MHHPGHSGSEVQAQVPVLFIGPLGSPVSGPVGEALQDCGGHCTLSALRLEQAPLILSLTE